MNPLKQLAGQTAIYGLGTIVPRLLNYLLLTPFYTRIFLPGEYGAVTELYAYVAFLLVFLIYGMETAYFRYAANNKKVYSTALISMFTTSSLFILLVATFNQSIANWIQYSSNKEYILWLAIIVGVDAFTAIPFAKLRQENRAKKFTFIKIINICVNIGLNAIFYFKKWSDKDLDIGIEYIFIANLSATIVTLILLLPEIKIKPVFDSGVLKTLLKYASPLLIVGLAGMINEVADKVFLKYLTKPPLVPMDQVGIYGANYKLAVLMTLFIQMFRYAVEPFFFSHAKEKNSKETYADVMKYFVIFGLLIFLGVTLFIDIAKYFIGSDFREGLEVVPIVLMANLLLGIFYNLSVWYKLTDRTRFAAGLALIGATVTIALNIYWIPRIGYLGSAWAHFICYGIMVVLSFLLGQKYFPIKYDLKKIFGYVGFALIIYYLSIYLSTGSVFVRLSVNSILLLFFVAVVYFIEKRQLKQKG